MTAKWNYNYAQTLWMKLFLARPDFAHGRSEVLITFEQALEIVKTVDRLTQGIRKIVYLVGWQGLGHDDCYPAMDVVNDALKRGCDASGKESLRWLFDEAKKYNTVISVHANVSDAVAQTPLFDALVGADALVCGLDGRPAVLQTLNGRDCYKTSYKQLWESGLFKEIIDRFCETVPVREAGTVHLDNFCIAESLNPKTYLEEQDEARNKMLDHLTALGIDVTSEYTYREAHFRNESVTHPNRALLYASAGEDMTEVPWEDVPIRTLGRIPATWWTSQVSARECMEIPPAVYSGHLTDPGLLAAFYGAMHGEDIWMRHGVDPAAWAGEFLDQFCTMQLPYFYLNRLRRLSYTQDADGCTVRFSDGVESCGATGRITKNGAVLKDGGSVLLPLDAENRVFMAYSRDGRSGTWDIPDAAFSEAIAAAVTPAGNIDLGAVAVTDGRVTLDVKPGQAIVLRASDARRG